MIVRDLGRAEYLPTWQAMRDFTDQRNADTDDELWLVEHRAGVHARPGGPPRASARAVDIPVVQTDRGGQVTYHGPGQVVAYPLVDLRRLGIFVKELVFRIEQSVIQTLDAFGVDGRRVRGAPGVFVPWEDAARDGDFAGLAKVAALGIKVTRGRSYHGVALNVAMDLAPFALINPCGYAGLTTVDLATLGVPTDRRRRGEPPALSACGPSVALKVAARWLHLHA